jgi:hypothetical protein
MERRFQLCHLCGYRTRSERDHDDSDTKHLDIPIGDKENLI